MAQLNKKIFIRGEIIAETGIMVGSSSTAFEIGGTDKTVVRNPVTKLPYIPGSSLKGKMRSLFELNRGTIGEDNGPTQDPTKEAAQFFGHINRNKQKKQQPSRLIVRDGELLNKEDLSGAELLYTEVKAENSIDRITSEANPRFFERVPKGARFKLDMVINIFQDDPNGERFLEYALQSLELVQDDYIGGGGSRGNGEVRFVIKKIFARRKEYYQGNRDAVEDLSKSIPPSMKKDSATNAA
ncbi:MAG: type III-A CRISPR-associated RAMP protein Csm3 [Saprospiraceae bacterium]|nr:type III-A CRISPR-associated RAMP protein Csm3 [Saprospiraceae bacterium]